MKLNRLPVSLLRVKPAAEPSAFNVSRNRGQSHEKPPEVQFLGGAPILARQIVGYGEASENVARNIEIAEGVGFAERNLTVKTQGGAECAWVIDSPREAAKLAGLAIQPRAVPELNGEIARVTILK